VQMISNLISNASKYSDENRAIKVSVVNELEYVVLKVQDEGIGISREDVPNIFSAFYRVDNVATRSQSGTGIGLYFSRLIVEHHSGDISVESELGVGTTIKVRVPREFTVGTSKQNSRSTAA